MFTLKLFFIAVVTTAAFGDPQNGITDVAFINVGSFTGADGYVSKYYVSRYFKAQWHNTKAICASFGMDFLTLESEAEQNHFLNSLKQHAAVFGLHEWINIGAMTKTCGSRDLWYWVDSGEKVNFPIRWWKQDPTCVSEKEPCLAFGKFPDGNFWIVDIWCSGTPQRFMCKQKDIVFTG